jgi:uncharacterized cupredoxin-like copper-binding protein/Cu/Ag efflux protein CusF
MIARLGSIAERARSTMSWRVFGLAVVLGAIVIPLAMGHDDDESTAFGEPGLASMADRTVAVTMNDDMRFTPDSIAVKQDETIKFVVTNAGTVRHEMMVGTVEELQDHAQLMKAFPEMIHEDSNAVSVEPGKSGEFAWKFTNPGRFDFACLVPGHYEAGMKGSITVASLDGSAPVVAAAPAPTAPAPASTQTAAATPGPESLIGHGVGEVRRVYKANGKIAVRHGPLVGLKDSNGHDMPGMTMLFAVKDTKWLDTLQVGDAIDFTVVRDGGQLRIDSYKPVE